MNGEFTGERRTGFSKYFPIDMKLPLEIQTTALHRPSSHRFGSHARGFGYRYQGR